MWVYTHLEGKILNFFVNLTENTNEGIEHRRSKALLTKS